MNRKTVRISLALLSIGAISLMWTVEHLICIYVRASQLLIRPYQPCSYGHCEGFRKCPYERGVCISGLNNINVAENVRAFFCPSYWGIRIKRGSNVVLCTGEIWYRLWNKPRLTLWNVRIQKCTHSYSRRGNDLIWMVTLTEANSLWHHSSLSCLVVLKWKKSSFKPGERGICQRGNLFWLVTQHGQMDDGWNTGHAQWTRVNFPSSPYYLLYVRRV